MPSGVEMTWCFIVHMVISECLGREDGALTQQTHVPGAESRRYQYRVHILNGDLVSAKQHHLS